MHRQRWTCRKCKLQNREGCLKCMACGSIAPSSGHAWTETSEAEGNDPIPIMWTPGEEAETFLDGCWVSCTIVSARAGTVDVEVADLILHRYNCDVRRPQLAECCICLDPLCNKQLGAFVDEFGRRACRHYFHHSCAVALPSSTCPVCRAEFQHIVQVPRVDRYPHEWFTIIDYSRTGNLTKQEIRDALSGMVPVGEDKVSNIIQEKWHSWDPENHGHIDYCKVELIVKFIHARGLLPRWSSQ